MVKRESDLKISDIRIKKNLFGEGKKWLVITKSKRNVSGKNELRNRPGKRKGSKKAFRLDTIKFTKKVR